MPALPRMVITGSSGFLGRRMLEALKEQYLIYGIARRSQARCGAPRHPNIRWLQVDIGERQYVEEAFEHIRAGRQLDVVLHLAAHYDFTGEDHPEYQRTNVAGLRHILDACRKAPPRRFVFASSVAACEFPPPGQALDESSPADSPTPYSVSKRIGEQMLAEYQDAFPSTIIRFAALFSDWCEYPPLFFFLNTWLSRAWNRRILGGKGQFAVPYLHVRDAVSFIQRVMERGDELAPGEVVLASTDGATPVRDLFEAATRYYFGSALEPLAMPRPLTLAGIYARDALGRMLGKRPFERPWMAHYIDRQLTVDASRTHRRLGWQPRERLEIVRRLPFLIENFKTDPTEWGCRNSAALKLYKVATNLRIHRLLEKHEGEIRDRHSAILASAQTRFPNYQRLPHDEIRWSHMVALRHLMNAIRTNDKAVFVAYCRDLARHRWVQGFTAEEVCDSLQSLNDVALEVLDDDPEAAGLRTALATYISSTVLFGLDQVEESFDQLAAGELPEPEPGEASAEVAGPPPRDVDATHEQPHDDDEDEL